MRSWIRPRNSPSDPSTSSAGREMVRGGAPRLLVLAIDRRILIPDNYLCQLAFSLIHSMKLKPGELAAALELLAQGDWKAAHAIVQQDEESPLACWAHGIVHLMESDVPNARYWYREAGRAFPGEPGATTEIAALRRSLQEKTGG